MVITAKAHGAKNVSSRPRVPRPDSLSSTGPEPISMAEYARQQKKNRKVASG